MFRRFLMATKALYGYLYLKIKSTFSRIKAGIFNSKVFVAKGISNIAKFDKFEYNIDSDILEANSTAIDVDFYTIVNGIETSIYEGESLAFNYDDVLNFGLESEILKTKAVSMNPQDMFFYFEIINAKVMGSTALLSYVKFENIINVFNANVALLNEIIKIKTNNLSINDITNVEIKNANKENAVARFNVIKNDMDVFVSEVKHLFIKPKKDKIIEQFYVNVLLYRYARLDEYSFKRLSEMNIRTIEELNYIEL